MAASDYNTRKNVATNPNTPPEVLLKLAWQFPQAVLENPVFERILVENPNLLKRLSKKVLLRLLKQDRVPAAFLEWVSDRFDRQVLLAVAMNGNTPTTTLNKLSQVQEPEVVEAAKLHVNSTQKTSESLDEVLIAAVAIADLERSWNEKKLLAVDVVPDFILPIFSADIRLQIAQYLQTSAKVLAQLIKDSDEYDEVKIRIAVAQHPNAPQNVLEQLVGDESEAVRESAANHPNTSLKILQEFHTQQQAVVNPNTPAENLSQLASSRWRKIRLSVARHPNTPRNIIENFACCTDWQLRLAVAFNLSTPINTLQQLIQDKYWEVRWAIAQNLNTPSSILEQLLVDICADVREVAQERLSETDDVHKNSHILLSPNLVPHDRYADDGVKRMRILSAEIDEAYSSYLRAVKVSQLSDVIQDVNKGGWQFRRYLLPPDTPVNILQQLAASQDESDRQQVARNSNTPTNILAQLVTDESKEVRRAVAKNPNTPISILEQLAQDEEQEVRRAIASNPNTPVSILKQLIRDEKNNFVDEAVKNLSKQIFYNPNISETLLQQLAEIQNIEISIALARHPNTPVTILEQLANTLDWQVRQLVAQNTRTSVAIIKTLIQDENSYVRNAAVLNLVQKGDSSFVDFLEQLSIVNNLKTSESILRQLTSSQWLVIRMGIASHPHTPANVLEQLANDSIVDIRAAVAQNSNSPVSLLENLARDENEAVWRSAINNPNIPISFLQQLAASKDSTIKKAVIISLLNRGAEGTSKLLEKSAQHSTPTLSRLITLFHPKTPKQFLVKNFRSLIWLERYAIAQNPNTPRYIIQKLVEDGNQIVCAAAKVNLAQKPISSVDETDASINISQQLGSLFRGEVVSAEFIKFAVNISNKKVLLAVANYPHTPKSILEKLIVNNHPEVAKAAMLHVKWAGEIGDSCDEVVKTEIQSTTLQKNIDELQELAAIGVIPEFILEQLAQDKYQSTYVALAASASNTPVEILQKLANDGERYICVSIAKNPRTTANILAQLTQYSDNDIRGAIAANSNTPANILSDLARENKLLLHQRLLSNPKTPAKVVKRLQYVQQFYQKAKDSETSEAELAVLAESEYDEIRLEVAVNPNTPLTGLEKLAADSNTRIRNLIYNKIKELARDKSTSATVLERLFELNNSNIDIRKNIAQNPNTPVNILEQLAIDADINVRKAVAQNSNIPLNILEKLATDLNSNVRITVIRNLHTPEWILEQLAEDILTHDGMYSLEEIAKQSNMPLSILNQLSNHKYCVVQSGVAANPKTTVEILDNILQGSCWGARDKIALNPNTPIEMLEKLVQDSIEQGIGNDDVPVAVAKNPNTPVYLLEQLAIISQDSKNPWTKANDTSELEMAIAENHNTPVSVLQQLTQSQNRNIRGSVAANPKTPVSILEELFVDYENDFWLAHNPELPLHILERLVKSKDAYVRKIIVEKNLNIPVNFLEELAVEPSIDVRKAVAKHLNTSITTLSQLAGDTDISVRQAVAENPNQPTSLIQQVKSARYAAANQTISEELATLALSPWQWVHAAVASNPNTSVTTLEQLATDKINYITQNCSNLEYRWYQVLPTLQALAENLHTEANILEKLLKVFVNQPNLRAYIALHPNSPVSLLAQLATDKSKDVRQAIARNLNTPITLLEKLVKDCERVVRQVAIKRYLPQYPQGLPLVLKTYAKSSKPNFIRLIIFLHPETPAAILTKNSRSFSWLERYAIAQNPHTPRHLVHKLTDDANCIVRAAARANY